MDARVTAQSQTYRLHQNAQDANIKHGQEVRADVPHVRVTAVMEGGGGWLGFRRAEPSEKAEIFFCNMDRIRIREVLETGDGGALPSSVVVENLKVAESGTYDLNNVLVRANGDLRIVVDEKSEVRRASEPELAGSWV